MLEQLVGWKPNVSLEEGLKRTVAWFFTEAARTESLVLLGFSR